MQNINSKYQFNNRDSVRKAREEYVIERGKTLEPLGMNKKDEMSYILYFLCLQSLYYFYISNFFHIATSTGFVFTYF